MSSNDTRALQLRNLHVPGKPIVLANVYDALTARIVASNPSSTAIATGSYAIAAVHGLDDDDLDLETHLAALRPICQVSIKHNKPITVDLQDGYGSRLEEAITGIIDLGASGCNLEDRDNSTGLLFPIDVAADRVRRAVAAATKAGVPNFVLNARTDAVLVNGDINDAIARAKAYLDAGAANAFVWGGPARGLSRDEVVKISDAVGGKLNVIAKADGLSIGELAKVGVARISVGPRLMRAAVAAFEQQAASLLGDYEEMLSKA